MSRLPKYSRAKTAPVICKFNFYLPLLALVAEYRFLDSFQINALSATSRTNTYLKLQKLFHNGYLERYIVPTTDFILEPRKIIYALNPKGRDLLIESDPQKWQKIFCAQPNRTMLFIRHELMLTNFRVCLTLALEKHPYAKLTFWKQGSELKRLLQKQQNESFQIVPDAYFILKINTREVHYFLEADRGTMTLKRFSEKIQKYLKFFHQNRTNIPRFFRVVTIAQSAKRAENLRLVTITGDTAQKKGSHRFWFGAETNFSLQNSQKTLGYFLKIGHLEAKQKMSLLS